MKIEDVELKSFLDYTSRDQIAKMTYKQSEIMMSLMMGEMHGAPLGDEILEEDRGAQIIKLRLKNTDVECSTSCMVFCSFLCNTPAKAVMWAYTLLKIYQKSPEEITMGLLAEAFPWGFPTDDSQRECWDAQKNLVVGGKSVDNALDLPESWGLQTW